MKLLQRFMTTVFETSDPYVEKITDPTIKDIARVALPMSCLFVFVWLISMPFGLAGQLIDAFVKMAAV